jgi:hypothetical protein
MRKIDSNNTSSPGPSRVLRKSSILEESVPLHLICIVMSAGPTCSTGHLRRVIKLELTATGDITITKRFGPTTQYFSLTDHVHGTLCGR